MLEVLKDTDRRLVMTLGNRKPRWTKIILDCSRTVRASSFVTLDYFKDEAVRRQAREVADLMAAP